MATVQSEVITSGKYGTGPTILISIYKRQALGGEVKRVQGYLFNSSEGLLSEKSRSLYFCGFQV